MYLAVKAVNFTFRIIAADGSFHFLNTTGEVTVYDDEGRPCVMVGINQDITERKQAEGALQQLNERLEQRVAEQTEEIRRKSAYDRSLIEASPDPLVTIGPDGKITDVNAATEAATGYRRETLIGADFSTYFSDPEKARAGYEQVFREGLVRDYALELCHKDGGSMPVLYNASVYRDADGKVIGVFAAARDITRRKRAEEALQEINETLERRVAERTAELAESERQFAVLIQNVESGVALIDAYGQFTIVNPMFLQLFGIKDTPDNILNVNSQDWSAWQVFDENGVLLHVDAHPVRKAALTGQTVRNQLVGMRLPAGGDLVWMLISVEPILNADGSLAQLICTYHDISEHKRAEEAMQESEARYRTLFNGMTEGFALHEIIIDETNTPVDWRFLAINPAFERLTGLKREEVVGKTHNEVLPGDDPTWLHMYGTVALTGAPVQFENYSPALKRYYEVLAYCPAPRQFAVIFMDITERKQVEEALRESEERFRTMANALPQLAWIAHPDGNIYWYNQRWYEYTGATTEQMEGWGWQSVHDPEVLPKVLDQWKSSIATGQPFDMEFPLRGADGRFRPFLTRVLPMKDTEGHVLQWLGTNTDITERKQNEETLQASLHEKEVLLREIHHRVKNNMQVISSLVSLQADTIDNLELRELFNDLRDQVRTMALVHEKLYQSASLASVDFAEYTSSLLNYLWRAHGEAASRVRLILDVQPVSLSVDKAVPCGLILNELVTNTLKHAFRNRESGEVVVALRVDLDGCVSLTIRDNGIGLPNDWRQSTSLGLQLVQMLAKQLCGVLRVQIDNGTTFALSFAQSTLSADGVEPHV